MCGREPGCEWVNEGGAILRRREVLMRAGERRDWKDGAIGRGTQHRRLLWRVRGYGMGVCRERMHLHGRSFHTGACRWKRDIVVASQVNVRGLGQGKVGHRHGRYRVGIAHDEGHC